MIEAPKSALPKNNTCNDEPNLGREALKWPACRDRLHPQFSGYRSVFFGPRCLPDFVQDPAVKGRPKKRKALFEKPMKRAWNKKGTDRSNFCWVRDENLLGNYPRGVGRKPQSTEKTAEMDFKKQRSKNGLRLTHWIFRPRMPVFRRRQRFFSARSEGVAGTVTGAEKTIQQNFDEAHDDLFPV